MTSTVGTAATRGLDELPGLEAHVSSSQAFILLHGSVRQLTTANWVHSRHLSKLQVRELERAGQSELPIVRLYEAEPQARSPLPFGPEEDARELLVPTDPMLSGSVHAWPSAPDFQLVVLAQLAEVLLLASPHYGREQALPLYVESGLAWQHPTFLSDVVRVYVSPHNPHAAPITDVLCDALPELEVVRVRNHGRRSNVKWLLVLTPMAFDGHAGERLAFECETALKAGLQPLLLFSPEEATLGEIVEAMPTGMISAGLMQRTVEWHSHELRAVSILLVARALGASMGPGPHLMKAARSCCWGTAELLSNGARQRRGGLAALDDTSNRMLQDCRGRCPSSSRAIGQTQSDDASMSGVQLQAGALLPSGKQQSGKY